MTRRPSSRLGGYAALSTLGLLTALVLGRPEPVALAVPFALWLAIGLALAREPRISVTAELERERALEGDEVACELRVRAETVGERFELLLALPPGLESPPGANPLALEPERGREEIHRVSVGCARWGAYELGEVFARTRDPLGLYTWEVHVESTAKLRVYPTPEALLRLLSPRESQAFSGNDVARAKGDGIEFADVRPFVPGDRMARINWRASARRDGLVVNELHPERNTDVVLFLDSFAEARGDEHGTLDLALRATAALAERYLARRDRVGLVGFGGILSWLTPGGGLVQLYRILDTLLATDVVVSYAHKNLDIVPRGSLPPKALVIAVTPLLDERAVAALLELRARRFDVSVVEVSPTAFVTPGSEPSDELAHRLWLLRREALRYRFTSAGVPVAEWRDGEPLARPLEEVAAFRRYARHSRA